MTVNHKLSFFCFTVAFALWCYPLVAQQIDYRCGSSFRRQLRQPTSIFWSQVPIRDAAANLASTRRTAVWVDRRTDPTLPMSFGANLPSMEECLLQLSESSELDTAWIDCLIYIGPTNSANQFATINEIHRQLLDKLPAEARSRWLKTQAMQWPRLSTPQELIRRIEAEVGYSIAKLESVPHDLWAECQLPTLPAYTRLGLFLAGFDLTFRFNENGAAQIVSMPSAPRVRKEIRIPSRRKEMLLQLLEQHANAKLDDGEGRKSTLTASWHVHVLADRVMYPPRKPRRPPVIRYTLQADNQPLGKFVQTLCKQLNLQVEIDSSATEKLGQRISFSVTNATVDTLMTTVFRKTGLQFELTESTMRVTETRPNAADDVDDSND